MASSVGGQDEPNRALWFATQAGKMEPFCPLGTTRCILREKFAWKPYNKSFIDQVCSVKIAGYWPCSFLRVYWPQLCLFVNKHAKKELGQYPAILTSHLINNTYIQKPLGCSRKYPHPHHWWDSGNSHMRGVKDSGNPGGREGGLNMKKSSAGVILNKSSCD